MSERNGTLYATHTVDFNFALLGHMAQADFMLEAKDGKFRVTQTNLKQIQKNSGSVANSGFIDVVKVAGTSWNNVMLALINAEKKVVDCISSENKSDW